MSEAPTAASFSLQPVFIGWITLLIQPPFQLFFTLWSGVFFGGMLSSFAGTHGRAPHFAFGGLAFFGVPCNGIFQRLHGLGTVYLATLATGSPPGANVFNALGFGNISASGVSVRDIPDPDQAYDQIKALVDAANC